MDRSETQKEMQIASHHPHIHIYIPEIRINDMDGVDGGERALKLPDDE